MYTASSPVTERPGVATRVRILCLLTSACLLHHPRRPRTAEEETRRLTQLVIQLEARFAELTLVSFELKAENELLRTALDEEAAFFPKAQELLRSVTSMLARLGFTVPALPAPPLPEPVWGGASV